MQSRPRRLSRTRSSAIDDDDAQRAGRRRGRLHGVMVRRAGSARNGRSPVPGIGRTTMAVYVIRRGWTLRPPAPASASAAAAIAASGTTTSMVVPVARPRS